MRKIPLNDPMYATKHVNEVGQGWYTLFFLTLFGWVWMLVLMFIDGEFTLWPLAFFIATVFSANKIGTLLRANGYLTPKQRRKLKDEEAKDREDA